MKLNTDYALLDLDSDYNIINLIIENNLRYFSGISFLLKNAEMVIFPTHNMEIIVFARNYESAKSKWAELIDNTEWKIYED